MREHDFKQNSKVHTEYNKKIEDIRPNENKS